MAKHRRYKKPKTILRKTLEYFKATPNNWTRLSLRRKNKEADDGYAFCAIGGCLYFADGQKIGNEALRYLAEAMGMGNAHSATLESVKQFIYCRNDGFGGRQTIISGLEKAVS
jgi:hypothetical protein